MRPRNPRVIWRPIGLAVTLAMALTSLACSSHSDANAAGMDAECAKAGSGKSSTMDPAVVTTGLRAALDHAGYDVADGAMRFFYVTDCIGLDNCFGNNPTSPYGFYCLPASGESSTPGLSKICPPGMAPTWRLREDEAIVLVGRTPPTARYFGFRSYVYGRTLDDGTRKVLFASLGDTLNPLSIGTSGTPCGAGGDAFDADVAVVTTADRTLSTRLHELLPTVGVAASIINDDAIPRAPVRMGLEPASDDLAMLFRVALFADAAKGKAWLDAPPVSVLRVTPKTPAKIDGFGTPTLRTRGTGTSEESREAALTRLVDAVHAHFPEKKAVDTRMISIAPFGLNCLAKNENCLGDNQDTLYVASAPDFLDDHDGLQDCTWVVAGVNHEVTGKATYMNVSVYMSRKIMGVLSVTGSELRGTAATYLPGDAAEGELYAFELARDCAGRAHCLPVPTGDLGVPLGERVNLIMRPYLEPSTKAAPDSGEIAMPYVIKLCK